MKTSKAASWAMAPNADPQMSENDELFCSLEELEKICCCSFHLSPPEIDFSISIIFPACASHPHNTPANYVSHVLECPL